MRVLVTGGAGFIGSHVVRLALAAGHQVTVLDDFSTGYAENLPASPLLTVVRGDIRDPEVIKAALSKVGTVFHLAAAVGNVRSIEAPGQDSQINVLGTLELLEGMRRAGVRRIIYSSSAAIFGEPRRLPIDEAHPAEPDSPYGVSKLAAEKHCLCYGRVHGFAVTALRYFNVYGRNQRFDAYGNVIPIFATRALRDEPLVIYGDGDQTRDFVSVEDVARANWLAHEQNAEGVFNIGSGTATKVADLAALVQQCAGHDVEVRNAPPRAGEVRHSVADISAARAFGYQAGTELRAGLLDYLAWLRLT